MKRRRLAAVLTAKAAVMAEAAPQFRESELFEYHLYSLGRIRF